MDIKKLFDTVDSLKDEYLKFLVDVLELESPTNYKEGVDAVGNYFIKKAEELGFDCEISKQEVSGNAVCITMNCNVKKPPVCLSGHMDTVHPLGFFGKPAVRIEDGVVFGPGIADCKGGIVASFMAMDALKRMGYTERPVKLLLQSDEENSSATSNKATMNFICEKAKGAVAFLNTEPSVKGVLTTERKGILKYEITVNGVAAHASICYKAGASAIAEACQKILKLEEYKDGGGLTINCGIINGGTAVNTVPSQCKFSIDIRYNDEEQASFAESIVKKITEKSFVDGTKSEYRLLSKRLAMPKNKKNKELFDRINDIYESVGFERVNEFKSGGGSDAADITAFGIPAVDSIGILSGGGHTINEHAELNELYVCAKRLAAITALI